MTTYNEGSLYLLTVENKAKSTLQCTYIYDGFVYFIDNHNNQNYKKNMRTKKLYMFNTQYQSWDTIVYTLQPFANKEGPSKPLPPSNFVFRGD